MVRRLIPEGMIVFFKRNGWIIVAGIETRAPAAALDNYLSALQEASYSIEGKRVLLFGYGGRFAVACALLEAGAKHVVLSEYNLKPDQQFNCSIVEEYSRYLSMKNGKVLPNPYFITLAHGDIRTLVKENRLERVHLILSNSVFEHLDDVSDILGALSEITLPEGLHLHFIDLRDHYFKYPFEMLCYSERVWQNFLNPNSNLNRFRLWHYEQIFKKYFKKVNLSILDSNIKEFNSAKNRMKPEYIYGDQKIDSALRIKVLACEPIKSD